jgi:protein-S-isoprenylcysteine O-methyltransferase Ste14
MDMSNHPVVAIRPPRPKSAVSHGVGVAGMIGMCAWFFTARHFGMDGSWSALANVAACGVPMVLWSLFVDKVHRNPSTGIDWDRTLPPLRETIDISLTKIAGLWATWGSIAVLYAMGRWYWRGNYLFAMELFQAAAPFLLALSIPYVIWLDRRLIEPKDGAYALGSFIIGHEPPDWDKINAHLRSWAVKGFFLAFMVSIVPPNFGDAVRVSTDQIFRNPVTLANWLISLMFVIDVAFATVGYLLTMRPLDAHIRSATPYAAGWAAALICYPPFVLMSEGGPLDYHPGTSDWSFWMAEHPFLLGITGAVLVVLTGVYAWATVAFGLRFSNLTDRGILTHGPYAFTKHPAYLSKNTFWWIATIPFLVTTNSVTDAVRNTFLMACVSGVYYWRARTEERHLSADPDYRAYAEWMAQYGPWSRFLNRLIGRKPVTVTPPPLADSPAA